MFDDLVDSIVVSYIPYTNFAPPYIDDDQLSLAILAMPMRCVEIIIHYRDALPFSSYITLKKLAVRVMKRYHILPYRWEECRNAMEEYVYRRLPAFIENNPNNVEIAKIARKHGGYDDIVSMWPVNYRHIPASILYINPNILNYREKYLRALHCLSDSVMSSAIGDVYRRDDCPGFRAMVDTKIERTNSVTLAKVAGAREAMGKLLMRTFGVYRDADDEKREEIMKMYL
jgi:hypothetical protein